MHKTIKTWLPEKPGQPCLFPYYLRKTIPLEKWEEK